MNRALTAAPFSLMYHLLSRVPAEVLLSPEAVPKLQFPLSWWGLLPRAPGTPVLITANYTIFQSLVLEFFFQSPV